MKRLIFLIFLAISVLHAREYAVVMNAASSVTTVSEADLRNFFLQKRRFIGANRIIPVNLLADNEARMAFEKKILKMNRKKLNEFWVKQHFKGVTPPLTQASYNAVMKFVTKVEGAIGYVPVSMADKSVKVLYEF